MTIEEARGVLGVTGETSADDTRRTYLRLTRKHNPETDPQGFARIRQAYEVLREAATAAAEPAAGATAAARPANDATPPAPADAYRGALIELSLLSPLAAGARADVVERACREHPDDPRLLGLAVEEMAPFWMVRERLTAMLRRAADHGTPGALAELTFFAPRLVRDDERQRLLGSESALERLLGARVLVFAGSAGAAAVVAEEALDSPTRALPAGPALDVAFAALAIGDVAAATRVRDALAAHFEAYQDQAVVLRPELAALWGLLQELLALAPTFPASAIMSVARVVRGAGNESANDVGRMLLTLPGLPQDKKMMALLAQQAPLVYQVLDMNVVFGSYGRHVTRVTPREFLGALAVLILIVWARATCLPGDGCGHRSSFVSPDVERLARQANPPPETDYQMAALRSVYVRACAGGAALASAQECREMMAEVSILELNGGCDRDLMRFQLDMNRSPARTEFLHLARTITTQACLHRAGPGAGH